MSDDTQPQQQADEERTTRPIRYRSPRGSRMSSNDESDQRLDPEARWPELFAPLTTAERQQVVNVIVSGWHEGWTPDTDDVKDLIDVVQGEIDKAEYDRRAEVRIIAKKILKGMLGCNPEDYPAKREASKQKILAELKEENKGLVEKYMANFDKYYEEEREKHFVNHYDENLKNFVNKRS